MQYPGGIAPLFLAHLFLGVRDSVCRRLDACLDHHLGDFQLLVREVNTGFLRETKSNQGFRVAGSALQDEFAIAQGGDLQ